MNKKIFLFWIIVTFIFGISKISFAATIGDGTGDQGQLQVVQADNEVTDNKKPVDVGNKICPVSGLRIDENIKATYEYQGKIYNFCCEACVIAFKEDPDKYIKKIAEELSKELKVSEK